VAGQSVATVGAPSARTASKSGCATFIDRSKYCVLNPQVPSTAEHRSITFTVVPGIARSTSAERVPMFCARRWQGTWYVTAPTGRVKRVSSAPSACSRARYSKRSRVLAATRRASAEPSSQGYSCLSM
jgi:hypothetical protein